MPPCSLCRTWRYFIYVMAIWTVPIVYCFYVGITLCLLPIPKTVIQPLLKLRRSYLPIAPFQIPRIQIAVQRETFFTDKISRRAVDLGVKMTVIGKRPRYEKSVLYLFPYDLNCFEQVHFPILYLCSKGTEHGVFFSAHTGWDRLSSVSDDHIISASIESAAFFGTFFQITAQHSNLDVKGTRSP